jgi:uncharacterized protein
MRPILSAMLVVTVVSIPAALPAQRMSDSYEFLKAVREANGNKVTEMLNAPGQTIVNTRSPETGEAALHIVAKRGDATYLRFLVSRGANINIQDRSGNTPLLIAVNGSCSECVDVLMKQRANLNLGNSSGETPLIRAVQLRNLDLARRLLEGGANPDQRDVLAGMSAREYAVRDGRTPALIKLLTDAPKVGRRAVSGPKL